MKPRTPHILIGIDPSLTCTGITGAYLDAPGQPQHEWALQVATVRTQAHEAMPERLLHIYRAVSLILEEMHRGLVASCLDPSSPVMPRVHVLIEQPAMHGVYKERRGRSHGGAVINGRSLYDFAAASGCVMAAAQDFIAARGGALHLLAANRMKKEQRRLMVHATFKAQMTLFSKKDAALFARNDDVIDAAYLLLRYDTLTL